MVIVAALLPFTMAGHRIVVTSSAESQTAAGPPMLRVAVEVWHGTERVEIDGDLIFVDPGARWTDEGWLRAVIGAEIERQLGRGLK